MSSQGPEPNLIDILRDHLKMGGRLVAQRQTAHSERAVSGRFISGVRNSLAKLSGANSELVLEFNKVAAAASKDSEPKVGLQLIMLFLERVIYSLTNDVTASVRDFEKTINAGSLRRIFVGHGRNPIWSRVVSHLKDDLNLEDVEAFESSSRTSQHIVDILNGFLDRCDAAVVVMTADDRTAEGGGRARQNVIHEIGLFQGRLGFNRVVLLQQNGTEDFSNTAGLQTVRFNERVEEAFYDLDRAVRKLQQQ